MSKKTELLNYQIALTDASCNTAASVGSDSKTSIDFSPPPPDMWQSATLVAAQFQTLIAAKWLCFFLICLFTYFDPKSEDGA